MIRYAWVDNLRNARLPRFNRRGDTGRKIGLFIPFGQRILSIRWDGH